jgi:hypothetical protein
MIKFNTTWRCYQCYAFHFFPSSTFLHTIHFRLLESHPPFSNIDRERSSLLCSLRAQRLHSCWPWRHIPLKQRNIHHPRILYVPHLALNPPLTTRLYHLTIHRCRQGHDHRRDQMAFPLLAVLNAIYVNVCAMRWYIVAFILVLFVSSTASHFYSVIKKYHKGGNFANEREYSPFYSFIHSYLRLPPLTFSPFLLRSLRPPPLLPLPRLDHRPRIPNRIRSIRP